MISKLKLKFGSSTLKPALETDLTPITVFVGPNNSGKSKILIEIETFCKNGSLNATNVILNDLKFTPLTDIESEISKYTLVPKHNEFVQPDYILFGKGNTRHNLNRQQLIGFLTSLANPVHYCAFYVSFNTIRIIAVRIKPNLVILPAASRVFAEA